MSLSERTSAVAEGNRVMILRENKSGSTWLRPGALATVDYLLPPFGLRSGVKKGSAMEMQKLLDGILAGHRRDRSRYHLTLGTLRTALAALPDDASVTTDIGGGIGKEHSYRGYYDDLAFERTDSSTVAEVRACCDRAATDTYEGYKGGDYTYGDDAPLWVAPYGCTGAAVVGMDAVTGGIKLVTRNVD